MTDKTLNYIHDSYNKATQISHEILSIINNLYLILNKYTPDDTDCSEYNLLLRNVDISRKKREKTFKITNLIMDIAFVIMYITLWLNQTKGCNIDVNITSRRKSLESELTKMLIKKEVHDLFGMRAIILNNHSSEDSKKKLFSFSEVAISILTESNRILTEKNFNGKLIKIIIKMLNKKNLNIFSKNLLRKMYRFLLIKNAKQDYKDFYHWIENSLDPTSKERIKAILDIPFQIMVFKDYINNPKDNNYQSLHYVLDVNHSFIYDANAEFEFQIRTNYMHQINENGSASGYKEDLELKKVFTIDDFSKVNIVGLSSYKSVEDDIDGIHFPKHLVNRRISNSLVPF